MKTPKVSEACLVAGVTSKHIPFKNYCIVTVVLLHTNTTEFSTFCVKTTGLHLFADKSYSQFQIF